MINKNNKIKYRDWIIEYKLEKEKNILKNSFIFIEYIARKDKGCLIERGSMHKKNQILNNLKEKINLFEKY